MSATRSSVGLARITGFGNHDERVYASDSADLYFVEAGSPPYSVSFGPNGPWLAIKESLITSIHLYPISPPAP